VTAVTTEFTLADLERMPEDGMQREILYGELIQLLPPHLRHEVIAARINESLVISNAQAKVGTVFMSGMGYRVLSDDRTWLQPDVSLLRTERVKASAGKDYVDGSPDLAVEVVSPSESAQDVEDKIQAYLLGGAQAVVVVYPKSRFVRLHLADGTARALREGDVLELPSFLPEWRLPITDIFAE
jgi:Uma2 family endonuclease